MQSADVVLVDDDRSRSKALEQGAKQVEFKVNWTKQNQKDLESKLGRKARMHIWPKSGWGRAYSQLHSSILADLVRMGLTYEELWMEDVSRKTKSSRPLYPDFKAILAIEKETLEPFFAPFCERAGIPLLVIYQKKYTSQHTRSILPCVHAIHWEAHIRRHFRLQVSPQVSSRDNLDHLAGVTRLSANLFMAPCLSLYNSNPSSLRITNTSSSLPTNSQCSSSSSLTASSNSSLNSSMNNSLIALLAC